MAEKKNLPTIIASQEAKIQEILPPNFEWLLTLCGDDSEPECIWEKNNPDAEPTSKTVNGDREQLEWKFQPTEPLASWGSDVDNPRYVKFRIRSNFLGTGNLFVDANVSLDGSLVMYSWPTAAVIVETVYIITATLPDGTVITILTVVIQEEDGQITTWTIKT